MTGLWAQGSVITPCFSACFQHSLLFTLFCKAGCTVCCRAQASSGYTEWRPLSAVQRLFPAAACLPRSRLEGVWALSQWFKGLSSCGSQAGGCSHGLLDLPGPRHPNLCPCIVGGFWIRGPQRKILVAAVQWPGRGDPAGARWLARVLLGVPACFMTTWWPFAFSTRTQSGRSGAGSDTPLQYSWAS